MITLLKECFAQNTFFSRKYSIKKRGRTLVTKRVLVKQKGRYFKKNVILCYRTIKQFLGIINKILNDIMNYKQKLYN